MKTIGTKTIWTNVAKRAMAVIAGIAAASLFAATAHAQASATASATASVEIATPISLQNTAGLDFGVVAAAPGAGTVVVSTAGGVTESGGVNVLGGSPAAAAFTVGGQGSYAYSITVPSAAVTLSDGTNSMTVDNFVDSKGGSSSLVNGADTFTVGATLNVGANQAAGSYTGSFDVTVAYN